MNAPAAFLLGATAGGGIALVVATAFLRSRCRLYGRLFSFALHELNAPITSINMAVANLLGGVFGEVPPNHRKWLEMTHDQITRLTFLLAELRDLVLLDLEGDFRASLAPVSVPEVLESALASHRRGLAAGDLELRVETEDGLPGGLSDGGRLSRSLAGLVQHARKFRTRGPILIRALRRGSKLVFEVGYEGRILPPAEIKRSLELHYPAWRRDDQVLNAVGLGLGFVHLLMRRLGGDLEFESDSAGNGRLRLVVDAEETSR